MHRITHNAYADNAIFWIASPRALNRLLKLRRLYDEASGSSLNNEESRITVVHRKGSGDDGDEAWLDSLGTATPLRLPCGRRKLPPCPIR